MNTLNVHLFDLTTLLFGTASVNYVASLYGKRETLARIGTWICLVAAVVSTAALGVRWAESYQMGIGRIPVTNLYESLVFFAWSVNLFYLFVEWRYKNRTFGAFVIPIAFARITRGWHGRRAAILSIAGFAATIFCYLGVNLVLPGLHSYGS